MFKTERNKRLFHIFSNLFIALFWGWTLYIQYRIEYQSSFEISFQRIYMIVLWIFIATTIGRIVYHALKLRKYNKRKKESKIKIA
ncbi:hypothetical protein VXN63_11530 [Marinilactibacillus sp. XAAS-LB27]|uniref:hypothetical protein n=1 Tax=Marinilactibacillus sp. XAAS-LB27 TaxID=3114538 RepID=UPI002E197DB5|nr:hypothetical protein [Marinilactibacillus sp. XAAS-LB27]